MKNTKLLLIALMAILSIQTACKKDDDDPQNPPDPNDSELITSVELLFEDSAAVAPDFVAKFRDTDGDGGNSPIQFDTIVMEANKTYFVSILLLDESGTPVDTISNEVLEEADDHMFFFSHLGTDATTTYEDLDSNGLPLGLETKWRTGVVSTGKSKVTLKHQPGVKNGTITPGETDIEVDFYSRIQ
jgi:hypothetical protein